MPDDPTDGLFTFEINDATGTAGMNPGWDTLIVSNGGIVLQGNTGAGLIVEINSLIGDDVPGALLNFDA